MKFVLLERGFEDNGESSLMRFGLKTKGEDVPVLSKICPREMCTSSAAAHFHTFISCLDPEISL